MSPSTASFIAAPCSPPIERRPRGGRLRRPRTGHTGSAGPWHGGVLVCAGKHSLRSGPSGAKLASGPAGRPWGRLDSDACVRNPEYITGGWRSSKTKVRSYPLDGLMFGSERGGPLGNALGGVALPAAPFHIVFAHIARPPAPTRYRHPPGMPRLRSPVPNGYGRRRTGARSGQRARAFPSPVACLPGDPGLGPAMARRLPGPAKADLRRGEVRGPEVQVGWHIWHHNSFSPLYRAHMDFGDVASYSDFIKPVLYNNCAGYRLHHHIQQVALSIFGDIDPRPCLSCTAAPSATRRGPVRGPACPGAAGQLCGPGNRRASRLRAVKPASTRAWT